MTEPEDGTRGDALGWIVRINDPSFVDWPDFQTWLDADPAHAEAYNRLAGPIEDDIDQLKAKRIRDVFPGQAVAGAPSHSRSMTRRGGAALWAMAACLLLMVAGYAVFLRGPVAQVVQTADGERRDLRLADNSLINLNGGTRLTIEGDGRKITLDRGEARFTVTHDATHPFVVVVGGSRVQDVGTIFNVTRDDQLVRIAVAAGAVVYDPDGAAVQLARGASLEIARDGALRKTKVDPTIVGGWTAGRLVYEDAPLAQVARDLTRSLGYGIATSPALANRTFTGTITISDPAHRDIAGISDLLGVSTTEQGGRWTLVPRRP